MTIGVEKGNDKDTKIPKSNGSARRRMMQQHQRRRNLLNSTGPREPDPTPDAAAKAKAVTKVAAIEDEWNGTEPIMDDGKLRVWHRHEGGAIHSFKYQVVMPVLPEPCVALAKEVDLMPTWHKFVPVAKVLGKKTGVFGGIFAYAELWLPWPLKNRGVICESAFYDCLDDDLGAYIVVVSSTTEDSIRDANIENCFGALELIHELRPRSLHPPMIYFGFR